MKYLVIGKVNCSYCQSAKQILMDKEQEFSYIDLDDPKIDASTIESTKLLAKDLFNTQSVPIVLQVVGGFKELEEKLNA